MKRTMWMLALTFVLSGWAVAQLVSGEKIVVQVPFEFTVGDKIVPAGEYAVRAAAEDGSALQIQNYGANVSLFTPNFRDETRKPSTEYLMVFKKYGSLHFLWEIKIKGSRMMCRLPESKAEKELRARNVGAAEEILLASRQ